MSALTDHYGSIHRNAVARVTVFPSLGLAYNRVKKNANTSTVILLRQIETGMIEDRDAAKWNSRRYFDLSATELRDLDRLHMFIIIRNPYSRVLSAFLDKFRSELYKRRHDKFELTPEVFGQFLVWLSNGGLSRNSHWDLQTKLMMLPLDQYDTVIRFENFRNGISDLLASRGIAMPENALRELYPSDMKKKTGSVSKLDQFYTPERAELVKDLFAEDFAQLGYDTTFPGAIPAAGT